MKGNYVDLAERIATDLRRSAHKTGSSDANTLDRLQ